MQEKPHHPRLAWAITGSGHYLEECIDMMQQFDDIDLFFSQAGEEVVRMYGHDPKRLVGKGRIYRDRGASSPPVGLFYRGDYHTLVIAPTTSNTVAKMGLGISDTLVTNIYAQAGKCRIPSLVLACDTAPEMETPAPDRVVKVWPRSIDLEHTETLSKAPLTSVVINPAQLKEQLVKRLTDLVD
ncbi:MAG TPA: flavoprotein [Gammaproteobacteria bacterium]|nr:flavoprotein [Gammaproteobacteria bacterium]